MTPHRSSSGRGTFLIDKKVPGVGRIHRASGTTNAKVWRAINTMIDLLADRGQHGPLEAMRDGRLKPMRAYALFRTGELADLPDGQALDALEEMWSAWVQATDVDETRRQRQYSWNRLRRALPRRPTPNDLPVALRELRERYAEQPAAFNRTRAAVMAFVRDRFGKSHPLHRLVADVTIRRERKAKRAAPTLARALEARDGLSPAAAELWWGMYTTGMGRREFDGKWELLVDGVAIHGTKRAGRERIIPLVGAPVRRRVGWSAFQRELAAFGLQPYDARRGFAHLMEEAGIVRTRRRLYLGHGTRDVTDGYETTDLTAYRVADGELIRAKLAQAEAERVVARRAGLRRA